MPAVWGVRSLLRRSVVWYKQYVARAPRDGKVARQLVKGKTMKARELKAALEKLPPSDLARDVEVWLPGSTIRLSHNGGRPLIWRDGKLVIEGNVNPGSALSE